MKLSFITSLNFGNKMFSEISKNEGTLFGIFGDLEAVIEYFYSLL